MTGYEFAERLARILHQSELPYADANQILDSTHPISRVSERKAVPLVCYLFGLADISPNSFGQYVDMVARAAEPYAHHEHRWTALQFADEAAKLINRSELTGSEADMILDNVAQAVMVSERLVVPLATYLCGRANCSPGEVGQRISEAVSAPA